MKVLKLGFALIAIGVLVVVGDLALDYAKGTLK
jgi:hypothetical protein